MESVNKKICLLLALMGFITWGSIYLSRYYGITVKRPYYDQQVQAANLMIDAMEEVKQYKKQRGVFLHPQDILSSGLIGDDFNDITTTLGNLEAKITTTQPDMAALLIVMLTEAGIEPGDKVAIGLSGSFPALNIAVIAACEVLNVESNMIASIGSSTYGGNNIELTSPEILLQLIEDGYLAGNMKAVTKGGGKDIGIGMDETILQDIEARIVAFGVPMLTEADFIKNLQARQALYGDGVDLYIGVGGNITSIGRERLLQSVGVILPTDNLPPISSRSGLLERYHYQGIPVINLLNIKKLSGQYNVTFNPSAYEGVGKAALYFETKYNKAPLFIGAFLNITLCIYVRETKKQG